MTGLRSKTKLPSPLAHTHHHQPLTITLRGITNDGVDLGVDTFRTVTLPLLKRLGIEEGLELRVSEGQAQSIWI